MDYEEAIEWLKGKRSMCNIVPRDPFETWQVRTCEADAAKIQQAYWVAKAHTEELMPNQELCNAWPKKESEKSDKKTLDK